MPYNIPAASGPIYAGLILPGSEDMSHRALLLAALADGVSEISNLCFTENTNLFVAALRQLGIVTQLDTKSFSCIVAGSNGKLPLKQATLWCGNSKLLTYFLIAACATTPGVFYLDGSATLRDVSLHDLFILLQQQGVDRIPSDIQHLPFTLLGTDSFEGGEISVESNIDSQLISSLLMISPYARSPFVFNTIDSIDQNPLDLTSAMMAEFGVLVHRIHQGQFMVPVPQRYQAHDYIIEPDFSLAAYFFAATALTGGEIQIQSVQRASSKQADVKFLSHLEKMGCKVLEKPTGLIVIGPKELKGIDVSMRDFSDSFFALAAIASFASSPTRIAHIGKMNQQESAYLAALKNKFIQMNIHVEAGENWIKIFPSTPKNIVTTSYDDYHIAMALSIIGLKIPDITIQDTECVTHVYPNFFNLWSKLVAEKKVSV